MPCCEFALISLCDVQLAMPSLQNDVNHSAGRTDMHGMLITRNLNACAEMRLQLARETVVRGKRLPSQWRSLQCHSEVAAKPPACVEGLG